MLSNFREDSSLVRKTGAEAVPRVVQDIDKLTLHCHLVVKYKQLISIYFATHPSINFTFPTYFLTAHSVPESECKIINNLALLNKILGLSCCFGFFLHLGLIW